MPVVSPLANITGMNSDVLFQMRPTRRTNGEGRRLVNGDRQVTLIYTESTDKEFRAGDADAARRFGL